jgi:DNA-binding transcriptional MerR regulator
MINFILPTDGTLTLVIIPPGAPASYSLETAANLAGVHPDLLRYYCQRGMFGPERAQAVGDPTFDNSAIYELRSAEAWRRHHGVNRRALPLICELQREIERLQAELRFVRRP